MINTIQQKISDLISFKSALPLEVIRNYFSVDEIHRFKQGEHFALYKKFGAHCMSHKGQSGVYFVVWAPRSKRVTVMGDFNDWSPKKHPLSPRNDESGIWEGFLPGAKKGDMYKFCLQSSFYRKRLDKADPYALYREEPPKTASIVWDLQYEWSDQKWLQKRQSVDFVTSPISIYEIHLGSWKRNGAGKKDNGKFKNYKEIAEELAEYIKDMHFTHVELMPITEHPFYGSWGYQSIGYFSPTSRYGEPEELMYLIDCLHKNGIGVILDWVPSHFPCDDFGLANFDGNSLFEIDEYHPEWQSAIFNNGCRQVTDFLISNALFWIEKFHIDGLRVDAVASMLYLDYARKAGEWTPNIFGGKENLESVAFLRELNEQVKERHPDVLMIAEESTAWPNISRSPEVGGLGFDMKWNMGWMHDILQYFSKAEARRLQSANDFTFSLFYAFDENFVLSLSHDEVVYGKSSILGRMPGTEEEKFENLKCLYGYMFAHPGKKLLFMGNEIAQWSEWDHEKELEWNLLKYDRHQEIQNWIKALNATYRNYAALHETDFSVDGFQWIDLGNNKNAFFSFIRKVHDQKKMILVLCNLSKKPIMDYRVVMPVQCQWQELLNSNDKKFEKSNLSLKPVSDNSNEYSYSINMPPLSIQYFEST